MTSPRLHTPEQAAEILQCKPSWLREKARRREIPFTMLGGAYRFTDEHLAEVVRQHEQRPTPVHAPRTRRAPAKPSGPRENIVAPLTARPPRRARAAVRGSFG